MLSAYVKLIAGKFNGAVVLESEDADVYVQPASLSQALPGDLLIKRMDVFINCSVMLQEEVSQIIIPLHVITGRDHTSVLYGHSKMVMKREFTDPEASDLLGLIGGSFDLTDSIRTDMKTLVPYCPVSMVKIMRMLLMGRQGLPSGKNGEEYDPPSIS